MTDDFVEIDFAQLHKDTLEYDKKMWALRDAWFAAGMPTLADMLHWVTGQEINDEFWQWLREQE